MIVSGILSGRFAVSIDEDGDYCLECVETNGNEFKIYIRKHNKKVLEILSADIEKSLRLKE